ncbi:MAG: hypothetical protein ABIN89_22285 [Chitinophagaceae bacterium]
MEYIITKFGLHFSIKIKHPYFNDDVCPYLIMEPDMPTKGLLKSLRLITKVNPGDIKVIAPVIETNENNKVTQVKKSLLEKHHYTFLIKVIDSSFYNIIDLDLTGFPKEVFYFSNTAKSTKLSSKKCLVVNNRFLRITFEDGKIPSKIKILSQDKTEIYSGDVVKSKGDKPGVFEYDLSEVESGLYNVVYTFAKADHKQSAQIVYHNPIVRKEPIIGVIDIEALAFTNIENEDKNNYIIQLESIADNT